MDRRIKTVWLLSIITMLLIITGQMFFLNAQYKLNSEQDVAKFHEICDSAIIKEFNIRNDNPKKKKYNNIMMRYGMDSDSKYRKLEYWPNKENQKHVITAKLRNVDIEEFTTDIVKRYDISKNKRFRKEKLDSILKKNGYEMRNFRFKKSDKYLAKPTYRVTGSMQKTVHVEYSSNPLKYEAISFDVEIPVIFSIKTMAWYLAGSIILIILLAFCMVYQVNTIIIQKRIDNIRHEFMKNMIYEMKLLPATEPTSDDAIRIGNFEFYYSMNELRGSKERIIITSRQAEILRMLAEVPNCLVTREAILKEAWGDDSYANSLALNVQISYLRRAMKSDETINIETVFKKGYILRYGQ